MTSTASRSPRWLTRSLQAAIERRHPDIAEFLRSGEGIRLQRKDSDIAEAVMVAMMERGILVLPIHDSFLVDYRHEETLREEMTRACRDHLDIKIEIEADPSMIDDLMTTPGETLDQFAVDRFMAQMVAGDEYQGYRGRREAFLASRRSLTA